jgi:acetyl esterase/lipase
MHGDRDRTVDVEHSRRFEASLRAAGVDVTFITIAGASHGGDAFYSPDHVRAIDDFLRRTIGAAREDR